MTVSFIISCVCVCVAICRCGAHCSKDLPVSYQPSALQGNNTQIVSSWEFSFFDCFLSLSLFPSGFLSNWWDWLWLCLLWPYGQVYEGREVWECFRGRNNLFHALVLFAYCVQTRFDGYIGQVCVILCVLVDRPLSLLSTCSQFPLNCSDWLTFNTLFNTI